MKWWKKHKVGLTITLMPTGAAGAFSRRPWKCTPRSRERKCSACLQSRTLNSRSVLTSSDWLGIYNLLVGYDGKIWEISAAFMIFGCVKKRLIPSSTGSLRRFHPWLRPPFGRWAIPPPRVLLLLAMKKMGTMQSQRRKAWLSSFKIVRGVLRSPKNTFQFNEFLILGPVTWVPWRWYLIDRHKGIWGSTVLNWVMVMWMGVTDVGTPWDPQTRKLQSMTLKTGRWVKPSWWFLISYSSNPFLLNKHHWSVRFIQLWENTLLACLSNWVCLEIRHRHPIFTLVNRNPSY